MPAIGARGGIQRGARLPSFPAPLPPTHAAARAVAETVARHPVEIAPAPRSVGRAVQSVAAPRSVGRAVSSVARTHTGGSDIQSSGAGYGSRQANAYKKSAAYKQAVVDTFLHQPDEQKAAIIHGAMTRPTFEGRVVLDTLRNFGSVLGGGKLSESAIKTGGFSLSKLLKSAVPNFGEGLKGSGTGAGLAAINAPTSAIGGAEQKLGKLGTNTAKDAIDLPAQTLSTVGTLGGDVATGHPGKALSDLISPYKQLIANPGKTFSEHPLDTALMVSGPLHLASRIPAGAIRAAAPESALGKAVSTTREGVQLGGNLTHERPRYSPYPGIKAGQVAFEKTRFDRSPTGALVPKSPGLRAKLTGLETSRLIGVNERIRQANRDTAIKARADAVRVSRPAKAAHGAKTALAYNPKGAAIPGAEMLARIADGTIRRPETFVADIQKHLSQVSSNRANLLDSPKLLKEHDAYVKALAGASKRNPAPKDLAKLFTAAEAYARDYKPVEGEAHKLGQFGNRTQDALLKRTLSHYAIAHMGAKFEGVGDEQGLVSASGKPLAASQILANANRETKGRALAFTSDRPRTGSAYYISSERRPLPQNATNTYFAYTHGLTDPSDQALLEQHVRMQGIVDAHKAQNRTVNAISVMRPDGTAWPTYKAAQADAERLGGHYQPIAIAQPFHPQDSLNKSLQGTDPANLEQGAQTHGLDLGSRLTDTGQGRWALADKAAIDRIKQHTAQITSNPAMRGLKMTNNQFRQVALGTSAKHIPGIIQEGLIRDVASGVGVSSWITGKRLLSKAEELNPEKGRQARLQLTGGTVAGSAKMMMTRQVSDHFLGTNFHGPLKAFESFMRAPGARQMRNAWKGWLRIAINGTKKYIEEQNQTAGVGKAALREFGAQHGPFAKALRIQGSMLDDAAKGLFDDKKLRAFRAEVEHIYGRWTDLTPTGQTALMLSPFGLWWTNSVKWLARSPVDRPVATGAVAGATVGTQQERNQKGLDLFAPNAVPPYMQGGIPIAGGKVLAQNYYSPFGVANDPLDTAGSLIAPWLQPLLFGSKGIDYLGKPLTSPGNPKGFKHSSGGQKAQYVINSLLATVVPLYSKAETIAAGGSSEYDSSTLFNTQTKTPGKGPLAGLKKATFPFREYGNKAPAPKGSSGGLLSAPSSSSGGWWNSSSSSASPWWK